MEEEAWLKLGVAGELSRLYAEDQRRFLDGLAGLVERALPRQAEVRRQGLPWARRRVREIRVQLDDLCLTLEDPGQGPLEARRILVKRGIALKTDEIPVDAWIEELSEAIQEQARRSEDAASALRRFME